MESDTNKTLSALWGLVRHKVINNSTVAIYMYVILLDGANTPFRTMGEDIRLSTRTIQKHINILILLGLIEKTVYKGKIANTYEAFNFPGNDLAWYLPLFLDPSTSLNSIPKDLLAVCLEARTILTSLEEGGTVPHYETQKSWQEAKNILLKYFKPFELTTRKPLRGPKIAQLYEMLDKDTLSDYAKWYHDKKYSKKGFGWGLFLFDSMYSEFEVYAEEIKTLRKHLYTSSKQQKAKFAEKAKDTKKWIGSLDLDDEGNKK